MDQVIIGKREALNNWLRKFHTFIDVQNRLYKLQESLFGIFKWGEFKPLPKLDYVLVFKNFFAKCEACSIDEYENNPYSYYQVSLVHAKNRRIIVGESKDKTKAFDLALNVARQLDLRVKDSVTERGKSRWL
jgi:hypothetical protein